MSEKMISKYIDTLAENLGVASKHVYETLYKQQIVSGIMDLVIGAIALILLIMSIKFVINIYFKAEYKTENEERFSWSKKPINTYAKIKESDFVDDGYIWWIAFFVWIVLIVFLTCLPMGILEIINPEYYVIKEILDVFGK